MIPLRNVRENCIVCNKFMPGQHIAQLEQAVSCVSFLFVTPARKDEIFFYFVVELTEDYCL